MAVPITLTNAGIAALVNAESTGTASVNITAVGVSASVVAADPTLTALPGQIKQITTVSGQVVAPDVIHIGMLDSSTDAYTMNSFGLFLGDGTLFAVYGQSTPIYTKTETSDGLLAVDITLTSASASSITFGATGFLNPPASTTVPGVVQLATQDQADTGTEPTAVLTPATAKAAVMGWLTAATSTLLGIVRLATQGEANAGTEASAVLTPATAKTAVMGWVSAASTTVLGVVRLATTAQANTGTEASAVLTPATAKAAVMGWIGAATSTAFGVVKLATQTQANTGTEASAVLTPATAKAAVMGWVSAASTTALGVVRLATTAQANAGTEASAVLTPATAKAAVMGWIEGQDGTDSGLDADMVDGHHAADFLLKTDSATFGSNANGYWEKRANGVIEQWGSVAIPTGGGSVDTVNITFPIPFTDSGSITLTGMASWGANPSRSTISVSGHPTSVNGASFLCDSGDPGAYIQTGKLLYWRVVGV